MKGKIFNSQEVQAIIAGNKTMFREVIKPYPILSEDKSYWEFKGVRWAGENSSYAKNFGDNARPVMPDLCPYQVGQKIFVKESWVLVEDHLDYETGGEWSVRGWEGSFEEAQAHLNGDARFGLKASVYYPADGEDENPVEMHDCIGFGGELLREKEIPWRSARLMPEWASRITLEITDVKVERLGEITEEDAFKEGVERTDEWTGCAEDLYFKDAFKFNWNSTHKKPEEKFETNPFVWVVDFKINK